MNGLHARLLAAHDGNDRAALVALYTEAAEAAPDAEAATRTTSALRSAGVDAHGMYHPERRDYHVYAHWLPVMEQRTWTENGGPWRWAHREIEYSRDMCPRSLELLSRGIHLNIDPQTTNEELEEMIEAINGVFAHQI